MSYKFKVGDKVRWGSFNVSGWLLKTNNVHNEFCFEFDSTETDGWERDNSVPSDYVPKGSNRYWYVSEDELKDLELVEEAEPLTDSSPVHDGSHTGLVQEVVNNYQKYYYGVDTSDIKITPTPNKPIMKTVTTMMKKLLDADTQKLVKAGFVNGDLELTERGRAELTAILFTNYKKELVEVAKEVIKEEDK